MVELVPDDLLTLISDSKWDKVHERVVKHPAEAHTLNENDELPIHHACAKQDVPVKVIKALIEAYPQSVKQKIKLTARIPLHNAVFPVSSTIFGVVKVLLQHYRDGAIASDYLGHTPLHSHLKFCNSPSLKVVQMLAETNVDNVITRDEYQMYPLHAAAYSGDLKISQYLIELYPEALLLKSRQGLTPWDLADTFGKHYLRDKLKEEQEVRGYVCIH